MNCPHCHSKNVRLCKTETDLGYKQYRCRTCGKQYNERTGTTLNFIQYPTEIVMLAVHYYYRFRNSLDDVVELMAMRGIHLSHQTIHNWSQTFGVDLGLKLREKRYNQAGNKWHADATYIRVEGRWCYLYRAIDKEGNLVDVYLSDLRDQAAAESFFRQAKNTSGITPIQITTDKEPALYPAIKNIFAADTKHRDRKYMNNNIESDHRVTKSRLSVLKGFKNIFCALNFCTVFEEIRQFFRMKNKTRAERRNLFASKMNDYQKILKLAA
jgi:putative transposase